MKLSGKDLADRLDVARSTLSEATTNGYLIHDRWDVGAWAVCGPNGRLRHYDVPDDAAFLNGSDPGMRDNSVAAEAVRKAESVLSPNGESSGVGGSAGTVPQVYSPTSLLPEGQDYFRPVSSGSAAHVVSTAIEEDNGTARGAVMAAGTGAGALVGWFVSGESVTGAGFGAATGAFVTWLGCRMGDEENRPSVGVGQRCQQSVDGRSERSALPEGDEASRARREALGEGSGEGRQKSGAVTTNGTHR